ncbi:MAG: alpha/beta hydrolase [Patescibacteria group bacterium]|jgi:hypothetical protein
MSNIFIIHGAFGQPKENWLPWLKSELETLGNTVYVPKFPTPDNQTLASWKDVFSEYEKLLDQNSIVIGHSLGVAFLLDVLERINQPIKAAFFVAGFISLLDNPAFDEINKTFVDRSFIWPNIKQNCPKFYLFYSDNDPYVPINAANKLSTELGVTVTLVKNAGHFNDAAGYNKFVLLLEAIKKEL